MPEFLAAVVEGVGRVIGREDDEVGLAVAVEVAEFHAVDHDRQRVFLQQDDVLRILQRGQIGFVEVRFGRKQEHIEGAARMNLGERDLERAAGQVEAAAGLKRAAGSGAERFGTEIAPHGDSERASIGDTARAHVEMPRARLRNVRLGGKRRGREEVEGEVFERERRRRAHDRRHGGRASAAATATAARRTILGGVAVGQLAQKLRGIEHHDARAHRRGGA